MPNKIDQTNTIQAQTANKFADHLDEMRRELLNMQEILRDLDDAEGTRVRRIEMICRLENIGKLVALTCDAMDAWTTQLKRVEGI